MNDNERYYYELGAGGWDGLFFFSIKSFRGFLRANVSVADKVWATVLHVACWTFKTTIRSEITPLPSLRMAKSDANVWLMPPLPLHPISIYRLRGEYQLHPDGSGVSVTMWEEYGPMPLLFQTVTQATATITEQGRRAEYDLEMFGAPWKGAYQISPGGNSVAVTYTSAWGELRYDAKLRRMGAPPGVMIAMSTLQERLLKVGRALDERANAYWSKRDLRSVFTEIYARETSALAEALAKPDIFQDPEWIVRLGEAFAQRYLDALDAYDGGRYVRAPWRLVFDILRDRKLTELDAAVLSIYAHIGGDLPYALADVGLVSPEGAWSIDDYHAMNEALRGSIEHFQQKLSDRYGMLYAWLDLGAGGYDERMVGTRIGELRTVAWYRGAQLRHGSAKARRRTEEDIEKDIEKFAGDLLDPEPWALAAVAGLIRRALADNRRY